MHIASHFLPGCHSHVVLTRVPLYLPSLICLAPLRYSGMSLALPFSLPFYSALPSTMAVCVLLSALVGLEYLVAVLQSGVFAILSSVYIGEFNHAKLAGPLAKVVKAAAH